MALEFPEMKKIAAQLKKELLNRGLRKIEVTDKCKKLIEWGFVNLKESEANGARVEDVTNRGHYVYIRFEDGRSLVFGDMIGKLLISRGKENLPKKYHIKFSFSGDVYLTYHPTLYGFATLLTDEEIRNHKHIGSSGITPLDEGFTYKYYTKMLDENPKKQVKKIQSLYDYLTGFQNGYFQDVLFCAGILPARKISTLEDEEKKKLYDCLVEITTKAVEQGGSADEADLYGNPGGYLKIMGNHLKGKPCPRCGSVIIKKSILGSNSYFCEGCQK